MSIASGNIFADVPATLVDEQFVEPLATEALRIERIVSTGQRTPLGQFLEQPWAEWVLVLEGLARLLFAEESEPRQLRPGDYVLIPPRARHRVEWTDPERPTVWLAIHVRPSGEAG